MERENPLGLEFRKGLIETVAVSYSWPRCLLDSLTSVGGVDRASEPGPGQRAVEDVLREDAFNLSGLIKPEADVPVDVLECPSFLVQTFPLAA